jgi:ABC-type oligopeptide transport system substrate-binding subunit
MKAKLRRLRRFLAILVGAAATACSVTEAEVQTYKSIAPEYRAYVQEDATLQPEQKQRRVDLLESWRIRVGVAK